MIKIIDGDLLESGADIICHQVNLKGKMNSGVAKQIREKYPEVFEEYFKDYKYYTLGDTQFVRTLDGKLIANMFAQENYGYDGKQYTDLNALRECLENVAWCCSSDTRVAMPYKIGCARGGANWNEVYAIIEDVFKDCDVELWRLDRG